MARRHKGVTNSTELTLKERYPIDYLSGPSDKDLKWLEKRIKREEKKEQNKNKKK